MGNQCSNIVKFAKDNKTVAGTLLRVVLPPPTHFNTLTDATVYDVIYIATKANHIMLFDGLYDTIDTADVKRFLISNINREYLAETFDCDNYSMVTYARIHEWASKTANRKGGLLYGVIIGNLKLSKDSDDRPHAMNFFIDSNQKLWLVEPQTNEISEFGQYMTAWTVIV